MITEHDLDRRLAALAGVTDDELPQLPPAAWRLISQPEPASVLAARQLADEAPARRLRRPLRRPRRLVVLAGVGLAATLAVVVSGGAPGGTSDSAFADWTSAPEHLTTEEWAQAEAACTATLQETADQGGVFSALDDPTAVLVDRRGSWTYTVLLSAPSATGEQRVGDCIQLDAPSRLGGSSLGGDPVAGRPAQGVVVVTAGSVSGTSDGERASTYAGRSAPDVAAVTVVLPDGNSADALVRDGWWSVWFPGDTIDLDPADITVRTTLPDGTVQEVPLASVW